MFKEILKEYEEEILKKHKPKYQSALDQVRVFFAILGFVSFFILMLIGFTLDSTTIFLYLIATIISLFMHIFLPKTIKRINIVVDHNTYIKEVKVFLNNKKLYDSAKLSALIDICKNNIDEKNKNTNLVVAPFYVALNIAVLPVLGKIYDQVIEVYIEKLIFENTTTNIIECLSVAFSRFMPLLFIGFYIGLVVFLARIILLGIDKYWNYTSYCFIEDMEEIVLSYDGGKASSKSSLKRSL